MRDFDSGENVDLSRLVNFETGPDDPGNDEIDIGMIRVIGNGQKLITRGPGSLRQFCGYQLAIAENGMSMQINHLKNPDSKYTTDLECLI